MPGRAPGLGRHTQRGDLLQGADAGPCAPRACHFGARCIAATAPLTRLPGLRRDERDLGAEQVPPPAHRQELNRRVQGGKRGVRAAAEGHGLGGLPPDPLAQLVQPAARKHTHPCWPTHRGSALITGRRAIGPPRRPGDSPFGQHRALAPILVEALRDGEHQEAVCCGVDGCRSAPERHRHGVRRGAGRCGGCRHRNACACLLHRRSPGSLRAGDDMSPAALPAATVRPLRPSGVRSGARRCSASRHPRPPRAPPPLPADAVGRRASRRHGRVQLQEARRRPAAQGEPDALPLATSRSVSSCPDNPQRRSGVRVPPQAAHDANANPLASASGHNPTKVRSGAAGGPRAVPALPRALPRDGSRPRCSEI